ncbi:YopX family protein [Metabacillus fastidiosus]|uniref:YopX family protein n=1 Tax=Metabacillus fastidiosus TaxID=1458 RepID=A0ABU6NRP3_9BACI|nr:YopX family protein [Metabacillus fastidiosus]
MRDIKFRIWDKEKKVMGSLLSFDQRDQAAHGATTSANWYTGEGDIDGFFDKSGTLILQQYTGFKDKSGIEIYEGDIVIVHHFLTELSKPYKAVIEWDKSRFAVKNLEEDKMNFQIGPFPLNNLDSFGTNYEVIGNIYENPDLLCKHDFQTFGPNEVVTTATTVCIKCGKLK